jgi:hypothetical protein
VFCCLVGGVCFIYRCVVWVKGGLSSSFRVGMVVLGFGWWVRRGVKVVGSLGLKKVKEVGVG